MNATTKISLTRRTNALGEREYHYETATHRYITAQRDGRKGWWVTRIYKLKRVGTMEPALMVRGDYVTDLLNTTLANARTKIGQDAERRTHAQKSTVAPVSMPQHATVAETEEPTDTDTVETPVRVVRKAEGFHPAYGHNTDVRRAVGVLRTLPLARLSEDFTANGHASGVRVEPWSSGQVRVSWLEDGVNDGSAGAPNGYMLSVIVRTLHLAGWSARLEGQYDVIAWNAPIDN